MFQMLCHNIVQYSFHTYLETVDDKVGEISVRGLFLVCKLQKATDTMENEVQKEKQRIW